MDAPNEKPAPPARHYVREWNDDGTVKSVHEVADFADIRLPDPPAAAAPVPPGTKQITGTVTGRMEKA